MLGETPPGSSKVGCPVILPSRFHIDSIGVTFTSLSPLITIIRWEKQVRLKQLLPISLEEQFGPQARVVSNGDSLSFPVP